MNKHDSERIAGMLESLGMLPTSEVEQADVMVFMTCCVREAADERLYGQVASYKNVPSPHGRRIIAVGGCIGQRDGMGLTERLGNIDVVFGTHNIAHLPSLLAQAARDEVPAVEVLDEADGFSTELPGIREHAWHAWVPITYGCDNFCTYCIVPYVRGREKSRPFEDIRSELITLAEQGVHEVTLLGQNVNSYGRDLYGKPRFADVLRMAGETPIERIRFATSHPKDLLDETIQAMAEVPSVMPQLHLPVQSGSDVILKRMSRNYTAARYLDRVRRLREYVPDIALSTDIIVGFPGETEQDFQDTLALCREARYHQAFTFIYSKRGGTPAARMPQNATHEEIQSRLDRLVELVQESAWQLNQQEKGSVVEILVEGASRKDPTMLAGRTPKNQVVHAKVPEGCAPESLAGTFRKVAVDTARTWYLSGSLVEG
ncbi:MAG: tRNA (N6-isopentenyl adenosine(37)-C2)-methylthiotransferase MiaB [Coriobacteriales bacterium]|nr:tRNA (N6-isopentenyl adenosine(37)-C2)-methylthiotransferase MiaB [Coriobacteriales bacterium]